MKNSGHKCSHKFIAKMVVKVPISWLVWKWNYHLGIVSIKHAFFLFYYYFEGYHMFEC